MQIKYPTTPYNRTRRCTQDVVDRMVHNQIKPEFYPSATDVMIPLLREQKESLPQRMIL